MQVETKRCSNCKKVVPLTSAARQTCPHCGAYWSYENKSETSLSNKQALLGMLVPLTLFVGLFLLLWGPHKIESCRAERRIRQAGLEEDVEREKLRQVEQPKRTEQFEPTGNDRGAYWARSPDRDVTPGRAKVDGSLSRETIDRIVRRHINEVRYCNEVGLAKKADASGAVVVQFTIAASGQVISSVLQSSTLGDNWVENCVVQAVRRWEFPKPAGNGVVIVSYPYNFKPASPQTR